ncbi:MAG: STAS domain-containing protein [Gammaproteobacteria bacterium]
MAVEFKKSGDTCQISITGEMTIHNAANTRQALLAALSGCREAEINLSQVSEIDTAGVQLLFMSKKQAALQGTVLRLVAHSRPVLDVIDAYNLASVFGDPLVLPARPNTCPDHVEMPA